MISSKKSQFVIVLILTCIFLPVFAAEPNEPETELKFERSNNSVRWLITNNSGRGLIKPVYMAEFYIKEPAVLPNMGEYGKFEEILHTETGRFMSSRQKEFIETSSSYDYFNYSDREVGRRDRPIGYYTVRLYAVSQEDVPKMVQAFIEISREKTQERIRYEKDRLSKLEQEIFQAQKELPGKEAHLEKIEEEYNAIKDEMYKYSSGAEPVVLARESIIEMDKAIDKLDIELAGIKHRLGTVEKYRSKTGQRPEIGARLDEMYIELMIDLSGLEAKKAVTEKILNEKQTLIILFNECKIIEGEVRGLREKSEKKIDNHWRDNLHTILAPEVYKNTVMIYPVHVGN